MNETVVKTPTILCSKHCIEKKKVYGRTQNESRNKAKLLSQAKPT